MCLPIALLGVTIAFRESLVYLARFFAGMCLIANGAYIGVGAFNRVGDTAAMLGFGSPRWAPVLFGCVCIPLGLAMWHGLGARFGLGRKARPVNPKHAWASVGLAVVIVMGEMVWMFV
ncbi:MAG: hypothetical protein ACYTGQ_20140 [Planctomycetota bacterium]